MTRPRMLSSSWCAAKESNLQPTDYGSDRGVRLNRTNRVKRGGHRCFALFLLDPKSHLISVRHDSRGYSWSTGADPGRGEPDLMIDAAERRVPSCFPR